jgi:hypothetical protein
LRDAFHEGREPTLADIGGTAGIVAELDELAASDVAAELVDVLLLEANLAANDLARVVAAVIAHNPNPLVLAKVFDSLVDAETTAEEVGIAMAEPVRQRIADRSDSRAAHRAAVVLDGAVRLALLEQFNRHVVLAELTGVHSDEPAEFATVAARLAGRCHDFWPEAGLREALERLLDAASDGEAAFELGVCHLAIALQASDAGAVLDGLNEARKLFASALAAEEDRIDAQAFIAVIDAVATFASKGPPEVVAESADSLTAAVDAHELWLDGMHAPWRTPRALALAEWAHLAGLLRRAASELEADSWLRADEVLPDVLRVYRANRSLTLGRHAFSAAGVESVLAPPIEARFVESAGLRAHLADWLQELSDDSELGLAARELMSALEVGDAKGKAGASRCRPGSPGS